MARQADAPAAPRYTRPMPETLHILYFAWLRERTGTAAETVDAQGIATVGELVAMLSGRGPGHAAAFATPNLVRAAVNQDFASPETPVRPGDEIAFFPPITGG